MSLEVPAYYLKPPSRKGGVRVGEGDNPAMGRLCPVPSCPTDPWVDLGDNPVSVLLRDLDGLVSGAPIDYYYLVAPDFRGLAGKGPQSRSYLLLLVQRGNDD